MKEKFDKIFAAIKKAWGTEQGKASIKLGFYFLFVVFAFVTASSTYRYYNNQSNSNNETIKTVSGIEAYKVLTNYSATYKIGDNSYDYTSATKQILKVNSIAYFIENNNLVGVLDNTLEAPTFDFKFWYLTPSYIYKLIQSGEKSYTTTFADKTVETSYLVNLSNFVSSYDGNVLGIEDTSALENKKIEIITNEKDNKIVSVKVDLSTYYNLINLESSSSIIEIDYK